MNGGLREVHGAFRIYIHDVVHAGLQREEVACASCGRRTPHHDERVRRRFFARERPLFSRFAHRFYTGSR